jgi:hypothetical protein
LGGEIAWKLKKDRAQNFQAWDQGELGKAACGAAVGKEIGWVGAAAYIVQVKKTANSQGKY